MAGVAACAAQGILALAQFWLFAPQQQAFDFTAQVVGVQAAFVPVDPSHCACATTPIAVRLLWLAHGDRAAKDIAIHCRATDARA